MLKKAIWACGLVIVFLTVCYLIGQWVRNNKKLEIVERNYTGRDIPFTVKTAEPQQPEKPSEIKGIVAKFSFGDFVIHKLDRKRGLVIDRKWPPLDCPQVWRYYVRFSSSADPLWTYEFELEPDQ